MEPLGRKPEMDTIQPLDLRQVRSYPSSQFPHLETGGTGMNRDCQVPPGFSPKCPSGSATPVSVYLKESLSPLLQEEAEVSPLITASLISQA